MKGKVREELKFHELIHAKERAPSTHIPPDSSRKANSPGSFLFPPEFPTYERRQGGLQDHEDPMAIIRLSEGARQLLKSSRRLLSTRGPPPLPNGNPVLHPPLSRESPGLIK